MLSIAVYLNALQMRLADAREDGQGLAEYGLILALIAILCVAALTFLQGKITGVLSTIGNAL